MLARKIYYIFKPFLPRGVRIAFRRVLARKIRARTGDIWPIHEKTARPPQGWPGWPDGKKFAVVLTHDVEGPEGVELSQPLAELEIAHGFRSSFNFIPEGTYRVPDKLRDWLTTKGFEVGVHDLNHDGHLYSSHSAFLAKAARINHYIKEWNASGFRGGFMLRNLNWVHNLNIQYDASTFDTDPFEPQPDGSGTIFPFWIDSPITADPTQNPTTRSPFVAPSRRGGYCELPYSLPQDSTLFILLQEESNQIWRKKLDWVAAHGGMALVNVHPDYLPIKANSRKSPITVKEHYADLLQYISTRHANTYWHPLPREMAAFVHTHKDILKLNRQTAE